MLQPARRDVPNSELAPSAQEGILMSKLHRRLVVNALLIFAVFGHPGSLSADVIDNFGSRANVGTGAAALVSEFRIEGTVSKRILMRASGKSLGAGALQDTILFLYAANGTLIAKNNDWQQAPNQQAISATGLAPTDPSESAILKNLAPGTYTVILRGVNNTT